MPFAPPLITDPPTSGVINRALQSIASAIRALEGNLFKTLKQFDALPLSSTPYDLYHGLGCVPRGYLVVQRSAAQHIYQTAIDDRKITLVAGGSVVASVVVY